MQGGDGVKLIEQLKRNYCEIKLDSAGYMAALPTFNSAKRRTLVNRIQDLWNKVATVAAGSSNPPNCYVSPYRVSKLTFC